jgi:hypothetical protein
MFLLPFYPFDDTDDTFFLYNNIKKSKEEKEKNNNIYMSEKSIISVITGCCKPSHRERSGIKVSSKGVEVSSNFSPSSIFAQ